MPPHIIHEEVSENINLPARLQLVHCPSTTIPAHWHEYLEILYLTDGRMTAVIQAEAYQPEAGSLLVINSNELHMTQTTGLTSYVLLQISTEQMRRFFPNFEALHFQTIIARDGLSPDRKELFLHLEMMVGEYEKQEDGYQLLVTAHLYEFLYYLYRCCSHWNESGVTDSSSRDRKRIAGIMDYVRQNFRRPLTLDDAAASQGLSREYFCRLFKKYTGQTFLAYVNSVRTMNFYEELRKTDESITQLMMQNGITNYKVFMRIFKEMYGTTPQKIRNSAASGLIIHQASDLQGCERQGI